MRTSLGGAWLMGLVITFIFLFTGFIVLTINYSKTVRVKNEIVNIVEKYEGINSTSIQLINNFLSVNGYNAKGYCTKDSNSFGVYGALTITPTSNAVLEKANPNRKYYYCIKKYKGLTTTNYYQIGVFYQFNIPIINVNSGFVIKGTSSNFDSNDDSNYNEVVR